MKKLLPLLLFCTFFSLTAEKFVPGQVGQALSGRGKAPYDLEKITPKSGSAVFWFKTPDDPAKMQGTMLLCFGTVKSGWTYLRVNKGLLELNFRNGKSYVRTECKIGHLKGGQWVHTALVWGIRKEKGFVRIYLDGQLKAYQRVTLPEAFSPGPLALGYNSGNWKAPGFPGLLDELALFDVPISEEMVRQIHSAGLAKKPVPDLPGRLRYLPFEGTMQVIQGKPTPPEDAQQLLKEAYRKVRLTKYPDEIPFRYSYSQPSKESAPGALNDGNDNTYVTWRRAVSVTGEFDTTSDVAEIEIVTRKYTKWYLLKQIRVSWDDGSGNFCDPVIINTYAYDKKISKQLIDESCKEYTYSVKNPGKMCRFKITPVGDGYFGFNEIRIRLKK
jgi:hypothetical protein